MPDRDRAEQLDRAIESALKNQALAIGDDPEAMSLTGIVERLCHLPGENFRAALKNELSRRADMTTATTLSTSTAAQFRAVTPFIIHAQAPEMVDFMRKTFGAEELKRKTGEAIGFYSEVRIGDSLLMIGGGSAARWGNLPSALHVYVDDCDAAYRRALDAGAVTLLGEFGKPADRPYGERSAMLFQLVERLPEAQFRVIQMRFVEQKSIREIAEELGRSEGAVKQLQLRAIENLRAPREGTAA